jgi:hypothetical protein
MTGIRHAMVVAACAVLAGGLTLLSVADPFHLRHARWFTAGLVLATVVLLTVALAMLVRSTLLRTPVVVVGATAALGWIVVVLLAARLVPDNHVVTETADGNRRLLVVEGSTTAADPVYAVVLRSGSGPFEQESLVYQGRARSAPPAEVRFVDAGTVEVTTGAGCFYRSTVEAGTLAVDPVHRPLRPDGC